MDNEDHNPRRMALAPYVPPLPSMEELLAVPDKPADFRQMVLPHIKAELGAGETSIRMATSINGTDAVTGNGKWDKAFFAQNVAKRAEQVGFIIEPHDYIRINRVLQSYLRESGNSVSQRKAAARIARDAG